jgi:hypothetical protein
MKIYFSFLVLLLFVAGDRAAKVQPEKQLDAAYKQVQYLLSTYKNTTQFPRTVKGDTLFTVPSRDWTSGFFPGVLWLTYEYSRDAKIADAARQWTKSMEPEKDNRRTHDVGFMLNSSYGNALRLKPADGDKEVMLQGARSLSTRFNKNTGTIRSWNHGKWQFPVIVDNLMNLELLYWATRVSGDSSFYKIATTHAVTTMKNHYRPDNSSYHVVNYDTLTGKVLEKVTHQGYADESVWARGQAWGLYGYTMVYRETKDRRFLDHAVKIAEFLLLHHNLPADKIPYWDFSAPGVQERDASAAAIIASALLELSEYVGDGKRYFTTAETILTNLSSDKYFAKPGTNHGFILMHSTGHKPAKSEIDVPIIYADYYYLHGLLRYKTMMNTKSKK